ncbi:alpha/beta fold hydrolase [Rhizobium sp. BK418]|uniref:alpha/beta hydrolase family protein n=1 Tax=Rhizobium sp. BK418 TaxID=2512120 RepID=UPI00104EB98F|nr:alpha/beta fold hydrolase [Rhizobium sp. BK418]TCS06990.1 putative alpha/beta hydrolase [Rhizobium sp. BK418]
MPEAKRRQSELAREAKSVSIRCRDGVELRGHFWNGADNGGNGSVIINPATGVVARYYHYYARFLAEHGFDVLTYDYRGIGLSRPARLKGSGYRWQDWGEQDFDAARLFMENKRPGEQLLVVGHSIGGFLPGFSASTEGITRVLAIGAQYGHWRDYAETRRWRLFLKWHVVMPATTLLFGYFPGRRLGWLEDLPKDVALDWAFQRGWKEPASRHFENFRAPVLSLTVSDDEIATVQALRRGFSHYRNAQVEEVLLRPEDLGFSRIGHFDLFHARHASGFWLDSLLWLRDGTNPWPGKRPPEYLVFA